jgi:hypothetical protein
MKSRSTLMLLAMVAVALAISATPASATQYTTTCTGTGQYDMLSLMFMQQTYLTDNYYLKGTGYSWSASKNAWEPNGAVEHTDFPDVITSHGTNGSIWDTGKINSVKDYQGVPNGTSGGATPPPYWGYPWDINLFDDNYVYLWITENNWGDAYSYKAFNNTETNNSMLFTRRCVVPGDDGTTSVLVNDPCPPGDTSCPTYATRFYIVPNTSDGFTYTSSDCDSSTPDDLGYAILTVEAVQPYTESNPYVLTNQLTGQSINLSIVPVTYQWGCSSDSGGCTTEETYEFGFDANGNNYGLVQWSSYSSPDANSQYTTPVSLSVFNNLYQWSSTSLDEGQGSTVSFGCSSNPI